jgi:hypothetical protein
MANVTKTLVAAMTPTQVAKTALGALAGNLQLAAAADRNWESEVAKFGETVNVPVRAAIVANDKAADAAVTLQAPSATSVAIVLNKHKEFSAIFEDVAKAFANQDVIGGYASDAAVVIAEAIEIAGFIEAYTAFTTNPDIGTIALDITDELVLTARKVLKDAKVPKGSPIFLFLSTKDMLALLQLDKYTRADALGDGGKMIADADMLFKRYGMTFVESQYVQLVSTTTHCLAVAPKQGLALASRSLPLPPGGVISADVVSGPPDTAAAGLGIRMIQAFRPEFLGTQLTVDALFGWKVIRAAFGQDVIT